jgi:hypothetical protein
LVVGGRHSVAGHTEIDGEHTAGWHRLPPAKRTALDKALEAGAQLLLQRRCRAPVEHQRIE